MISAVVASLRQNRDTRKRLLINRHIAKMTPEQIARRFSIYRNCENGLWQRREPQNKQPLIVPSALGREKEAAGSDPKLLPLASSSG